MIKLPFSFENEVFENLNILFDTLGAPDKDVRIVGGSIRNLFIGLPVSDIDLATPDPPDLVVKRLNSEGIKNISIGASYGTIKAIMGLRNYDITTLRRDTECDGRYAKVEFTNDWYEDAKRRDFTFNALSMRPDGTIFDYFSGRDHIKSRLVRFIGNPEKRIKEDYLRILRYFRFIALLNGQEDIVSVTAAKCMAHGLSKISRERIREELIKILNINDPCKSIKLMIRNNIFDKIFGSEFKVLSLDDLITNEKNLGHSIDTNSWYSRFVTLFGKSALEISRNLKCSKKDQIMIEKIMCAGEEVSKSLDKPKCYHFFHKFGQSASISGVLIAIAREKENLNSSLKSLYALFSSLREVNFPIKGEDIISLGITEGPKIGKILKDLEMHWIDSGFTDSKETLLKKIGSAVIS